MGELALLQDNALAFLFRWIHLLGGVAWIGLLWYFNFVQGEYFKQAEAASKSDAIRKLVPRALWWFRWGAMVTLLSGLAMLGAKHLTGYGIIVGSTLGTLQGTRVHDNQITMTRGFTGLLVLANSGIAPYPQVSAQWAQQKIRSPSSTPWPITRHRQCSQVGASFWMAHSKESNVPDFPAWRISIVFP